MLDIALCPQNRLREYHDSRQIIKLPRGLMTIPYEDDECLRVLQAYENFITERERRVRELIRERTADEDMQENIYDALLALIVHGKTSDQ